MKLKIDLGENCTRELRKYRVRIEKKSGLNFTLAQAATHAIQELLGDDAKEEAILIYTQ